MNRDKYIEEMAQVLKDYTKKKNITASYVILEDYAEALYNEGYCKASEVAREILEKVKETAEAYFWGADSIATTWFLDFCENQEKKYESEGEG
jgi:hypothetical protein